MLVSSTPGDTNIWNQCQGYQPSILQDQSPWEMVKRCRTFLGAEAEELFKDRIRIIK